MIFNQRAKDWGYTAIRWILVILSIFFVAYGFRLAKELRDLQESVKIQDKKIKVLCDALYREYSTKDAGVEQ